MKAYFASPVGAVLRETETPPLKPGHLLVRVRANGLNRIDLQIARGHDHGAVSGSGAPLGLDWAGEVVAVGEGVEGYKSGDQVMGAGGGGFADYVSAHPSQTSHMPGGMSFEEAACYPVAMRTMHNAIVTEGELLAGQSVLIQGASSGVGLLGLQIAKFMGAGLVIGSSTNDARAARLKDYGADLGVNSTDPAWVDTVLEATDGKGVDLVVDQVAGELLNETIKATRILGRIISVGRLGGNLKPFDAENFAMRRISLIGVTFRTRTAAEVAEIGRRAVKDLQPAFDAGKFSLPVDSVFPFARLQDAMALMEGNGHFGKIVIGHDNAP